mmetsp:Transcript_43699/g.95340  ORF Transcript_43699/g.95340 Transcript_43699/m.95340 type:complete len:324 (-) Transcript_43699:54-1025(-)
MVAARLTAALGGAVGSRRGLLRLALFLALALPALAYGEKGKKSKFLAAYPMIFKFCLFWWCVFVFGVMGVYITDHLLFRKFGPAKVKWAIEHTFTGSAARAAYWAQVVDPRQWAESHPVLASASIRMVKIVHPPAEGSKEAEEVKEAKVKEAKEAKEAKIKAAKTEKEKKEIEEEDDEEIEKPRMSVTPIPHGLLESGLGLMLRHKDEGVRKGTLFCTRECKEIATPDEGPWTLVMRTVDVGAGYPFLPDTEESTMEMWPAAKDGSVRCCISGEAAVNSRVFRWWTGLQPASRTGATALLEAIDTEVNGVAAGPKEDAPKKND